MTTINVDLPDDLYFKMKKLMLECGCKTWVEFFRHLVTLEEEDNEKTEEDKKN